MAISRQAFGSYKGKAVDAYTLTNANGLSARLITYGAALTQMHVPGRDGQLADVVLGFDDLDGYVATDTYIGSTCGRYGNRIREGRFTLGERSFALTANEGANHLHGGLDGFNRQVWHADADEAGNAVVFSLVSPAGSQGYPGELLIKTKFVLTPDDRLLVEMSAVSDDLTILNIVHHSYWNMAGHDSGDLLDQVMTVDADFYTPVDAQLLATGEILKVAGTPFDFRAPTPIRNKIAGVPSPAGDQAKGTGYDHNFVLNGHGPGMRPVATLVDPASGRGFSLRANEPGVQIYTGGGLNAGVVGKGAKPYCPYAGVTFESQKFPGSPNFAHFLPARLEAGQVYDHRMEFQFFAR